MKSKRVLRHLGTPSWRTRQTFPARALQAIESTIRTSEATHSGQVCFAVETALELAPLLRGISARERAIDAFSRLRVWDTERNNGVLIYLLLADRDVEIVADRGIHARVGADEWERICRSMEQSFRAGQFEAGVIEGIRAVSTHLSQHYPRSGPQANEISDRPILL
ncbi:MAG: TPM domain-containing protein [Gammaproteobacteria bacterium]|nr:TPM domain-containing protein [Gammaproteobacteria bacterium]